MIYESVSKAREEARRANERLVEALESTEAEVTRLRGLLDATAPTVATLIEERDKALEDAAQSHAFGQTMAKLHREVIAERDRARELLAATEAQVNVHLQARLAAERDLARVTIGRNMYRASMTTWATKAYDYRAGLQIALDGLRDYSLDPDARTAINAIEALLKVTR